MPIISVKELCNKHRGTLSSETCTVAKTGKKCEYLGYSSSDDSCKMTPESYCSKRMGAIEDAQYSPSTSADNDIIGTCKGKVHAVDSRINPPDNLHCPVQSPKPECSLKDITITFTK